MAVLTCGTFFPNAKPACLRQKLGRGIPRLASNAQLLDSAQQMLATHSSTLFAQDPQRTRHFHYACGDISVDLSGQRWDKKTLHQLIELARESGWREELEKMTCGAPINRSENRAVLHMALRATRSTCSKVPEWATTAADNTLQQMRSFASALHQGTLTGADDHPLTDLILVGIGGSLLGPRVVYEALRAYWQPGLRLHFLENIDPCAYSDLIEPLNAKQTLVLIASKTFTTLETLKNAEALRTWMLEDGVSQTQLHRQFIALTAAPHQARNWGIESKAIFPMWEWVGGRFSLWSSIGLPLMLALKPGTFDALLSGAALMDDHLQQTEDSKNLPLLLALADSWNHNFLGASARAVVPYSHRLHRLGEYLKQLEMESNGKGVNKLGEPLAHHSAPLVIDGVGTPAQHSFFQLLHQGSHSVAVEILTIDTPERRVADHHEWLNANAKGQIQALIHGSERNNTNPHTFVAGGQPVSHIQLKQIKPESLGQLLALYEHKVFILAQIWESNAFDQPGVELGKQLAHLIHHSEQQSEWRAEA